MLMEKERFAGYKMGYWKEKEKYEKNKEKEERHKEALKERFPKGRIIMSIVRRREGFDYYVDEEGDIHQKKNGKDRLIVRRAVKNVLNGVYYYIDEEGNLCEIKKEK